MKRPLIFLLLLNFLSACSQRSETAAVDHHHDDVKLFLSAYGNFFEIFVEADPLSSDQYAVFNIHVTLLEDFTPLTDGRLQVQLLTDGRTISQTTREQERQGIYKISLKPEQPGMARLIFTIDAGGLNESIEIENIEVFSDAHTAIHSAEDMFASPPGAIIMTKEQSWNIDFATGIATNHHLGQIIKTVGRILPARNDELLISARTGGLVSFQQQNLYEGFHVKSGQALLSIQGGALAEGNAAIRFQEARNNFERTKADFERLSELRKDLIVTEAEFLRAKNEFENAAALFDHLQQHFTESGQLVTSPFPAYIKEVFVRQGTYVNPGDPLINLVRNNELVIRAELQAHYADVLRDLQTAHILMNNGMLKTLEELQGSFISIAKNLDPGSNLLPVHMRIGVSEGLIPGSLVDVFLKMKPKEKVLAVPNQSLIEEQGLCFVFVQHHPECFIKRQVQTGNTDGLLTEIRAGLLEGERIVTRGAIMVKLASTSSSLDPHSGHVH